MLKFIVEFITRYPTYRSGIPPLQELFRLLTRDASDIVDKSVITRALAFLWLLTFPDDGVSAKDRIDKLKSLGLHAERPDFDSQVANALFPGTDFGQFGLKHSSRSTMASMDMKVLGGTGDAFVMNLTKIQLSWRFVTTSSGYLGSTRVGIAVGDALRVLKGSCVPVVLRKALGKTHIVVGTAFVVGLMNGEAAKVANQDTSALQWFELR
ncbi:hypothetical protein B0T10DRAFT_233837 [Thelonectria olida]|uniref:Uncharacterized protein n=1 Tax=Thelonectria olida TaxID=1576542 RepID=A0A9P9AFK3_9HYPO|nr:hypothetical protein B0T10DRAFT_233837 [Thelonectria olida]